MRIAVISDTHGHVSSVRPFMDGLGKIDMLLHLGDHADDAVEIAKLLGCDYRAVCGNCDYFGGHPRERVEVLDGKRIYMTHGDCFDELTLSLRAEEKGCDLALFGHTHMPLLTASGKLLILNPGSPSSPRNGKSRSCALVEIVQGEICIKILTI